MPKRRRFKQTVSFKDRLISFAKDSREKASKLPNGSERDDMIRKARSADTAAHLDDWANSSGLQSPKQGQIGAEVSARSPHVAR